MDSKSWDERYATKEYVWKVTVNQFVEEHLSDLEPGTAIDLLYPDSCNHGELAGELPARFEVVRQVFKLGSASPIGDPEERKSAREPRQ